VFVFPTSITSSIDNPRAKLPKLPSAAKAVSFGDRYGTT